MRRSLNLKIIFPFFVYFLYIVEINNNNILSLRVCVCVYAGRPLSDVCIPYDFFIISRWLVPLKCAQRKLIRKLQVVEEGAGAKSNQLNKYL